MKRIGKIRVIPPPRQAKMQARNAARNRTDERTARIRRYRMASYWLRRPCWICDRIGFCAHRELAIAEAEAGRGGPIEPGAERMGATIGNATREAMRRHA